MRKGWKRIHRMVVLPDYQGIGIGIRLVNEISNYYIDKGFNVNLTTTTPALVGGLSRSKNWALVRASRVKNTLDKNIRKYYGSKREHKALGSSSNRITYSFNYKK